VLAGPAALAGPAISPQLNAIRTTKSAPVRATRAWPLVIQPDVAEWSDCSVDPKVPSQTVCSPAVGWAEA
jgi:hypothetical protein